MTTVTLIPTSITQSNYSQSAILSGTEYILRFRWNTRAYKWFFCLETVDGTRLISWRKVVGDRPLMQRDRDSRLPPGQLWVLDTQGENADPTLRSLGARHRLIYVE